MVSFPQVSPPKTLYTPFLSSERATCLAHLILLHFITRRVVGEQYIYPGADKSLTRPTSRCILFDGENISFDASRVIYINSTNIPPIMIINRIYEHQNLLSL